jgi:hypothetical protein
MSEPDGIHDPQEALLERLTLTGRLSKREAVHLVGEVLAFHGDSLEQFVQRRHRELQREGLQNAQIYRCLAAEVAARRFRVEAPSERQLRRLIYG